MSKQPVDDLPRRIARLFPSRWDRHYIVAKLRSDPLYESVHEQLAGSDHPLLDLGCGLGLLAFYLRERGVGTPLLGLDYDARKIAEATRASASGGYAGLEFRHHDARLELPPHSGNVTILDILQFFEPAEQATLLQAAAARLAPGGRLVIRSGLRDRSWRFRVTVAGDVLARATFWMKSGPIHYPTRDTIEQALAPFGPLSIRPLWGSTPFNNHLVVLVRAADIRAA